MISRSRRVAAPRMLLACTAAAAAAIAAAALAFATVAPAFAQTTCAAGTCTATFEATGTPEGWTVPAGVTHATFVLEGAGGGGQLDDSWGDLGGNGGKVTSTFAVSLGETLTLVVGAGGGDVNGLGGASAPGGYGGGGAGGKGPLPGPGGGGGSFVFAEGSLLIAAGGGGAGGSAFGYGGDGGQVGGLGGDNSTNAEFDGNGATVSEPGKGRLGGASGGGPTATSAIEGAGGAGAGSSAFAGGGGGGGYYGGAGGGAEHVANGAGGGGSDFVAVAGAGTVYEDGGGGAGGGENFTTGTTEPAGAGTIAVSYAQSATTTTLHAPSSVEQGRPLTLTARVSPAPAAGTVEFEQDGVEVAGCGEQPVNGAGEATCVLEGAAAGGHSYSATFSGTAGFAYTGSASETSQVQVEQPPVTQGASAPTDSAQTLAVVPASTPAPAPASTAAPAPAPASAPAPAAFKLLYAGAQPLINARLLKKRTLCMHAACTLSGSGKVMLPGQRAPLRLASASITLAPGQTGDLDLAVPSAVRHAVRAFLLEHPRYKVHVDITLTLSDGATLLQTIAVQLPIWTYPGFR